MIHLASTIRVNTSLLPPKLSSKGCTRWTTLATTDSHPGEFELNEDHPIWKKFDYDDWGPQPQDMLDDYPQGAIWSCCDKQGTKKGCVRGLHINAEDYVDIEAKKLKV